MARGFIRRRRDGLHEIVRRGSLKRAALALGAVGLGLGLVTLATAAFALFVAIGVPLILAGGAYLALRRLRGYRRPAGAAAPSPSPSHRPLRAIDGGLRGTPIPRLSPFATPQAGRKPVRDAGA